MEEIRIRKAGAGDLESILHHRRAMFEEMGECSKHLDGIEAASADYFRGALTTGAFQGWLGETVDGEVVCGGGIAIVAWPGFPGEKRGRRASILNMYSEPGRRSRGLAKRLVETMLAWCRAEGFGSVYLHASEFGRPLYESIGFEATNEMHLKL
jgi:GNAT superfamily N-acetyltransferase